MTAPVVALLGLGFGRFCVALPIPVILAWPIVGLPLGLVAALQACRRGASRGGRPGLASTVLLALCQLHGLKIDLRSARGERMFLWVF